MFIAKFPENKYKKPFMKIPMGAEGNIWYNDRQLLVMNISFETEEHNIYDPHFDSDSELDKNAEDWSNISIDNEDKMHAKLDPLFDAQSIEEI